MTRINLLPHREIKRQARRRQIAVLAGVTAGIGALIVGAVHVAIITQIEYQNGRNKYLTGQIAVLDKQIEEIKKLKEQTQALLARKKVVETLQTGRSDVVHLLDEVVRLLPDGVYLKRINQAGNRVHLTGFAQSNARVSTLMRNLDDSPWLEGAALVEIKAAQVGPQRLSDFYVTVGLTRPAAPAAAPAGKK
ncbi:MAG: PilN domain-containing protein [Betaproteobacteria bacterium]|nr:PilN domain-containing protein [Betaproteobacteria bacterium]